MLGRKPGHKTGTAALEGIDFWIAAEPAYLKSNELLDFAPRRESNWTADEEMFELCRAAARVL